MADCNITGLLRDINTENFVKDELSGTLEALRRNLDERYVKRIKNTISSAQKECIQTPTKEAGLLMAMREFATGENRQKFDRAIDILNSINTVSIIQKDVSEIQSQKSVYSMSGDTLENCESSNVSPSLVNALLMLSILKIL